jgi:hypothetical protein
MRKLDSGNTLLGRVELHLNKFHAITRGWQGSRLNLDLNDIPIGYQRKLVYATLDKMTKKRAANDLSSEIKSLLVEVHSAITIPCLRERHLHLVRASEMLKQSPSLRIALSAKYKPIDDVSDSCEAMEMCRQELNLAVKHVATMLSNCRSRNLAGPRRVATDLRKAHGAVLSSWSFFGMAGKVE